jgi:hypothetical protein
LVNRAELTQSLEKSMSATPRPFSDPELSAFMQKFERAIDEFLNGNNQPWLELAAQRCGDGLDALVIGPAR